MNSIAGSSKSMPEKMPDKRMPPIKHFCLRVANKDMNLGLESQTAANKLAVNTNKYWPRQNTAILYRSFEIMQSRAQLMSIKYAKNLTIV